MFTVDMSFKFLALHIKIENYFKKSILFFLLPFFYKHHVFDHNIFADNIT